MRTSNQQNPKSPAEQVRSLGRCLAKRLRWQASIKAVFFLAIGIAILSPLALRATTPEGAELSNDRQNIQADKSSAKVVGVKYNCVHVLKLEKTLKLYREILGFELVGAEVLHGKGIEGMLVMKLKANDCLVHLSLPAPEHRDTVGPIGNTNHNHFMLLVNDIVPICEKLKQEGYALENEAYARDKYSFFTGPNGEIVGLTEHP